MRRILGTVAVGMPDRRLQVSRQCLSSSHVPRVERDDPHRASAFADLACHIWDRFSTRSTASCASAPCRSPLSTALEIIFALDIFLQLAQGGLSNGWVISGSTRSSELRSSSTLAISSGWCRARGTPAVRSVLGSCLHGVVDCTLVGSLIWPARIVNQVGCRRAL